MAIPSRNHDWLALTVETPLEPDLSICDPHHHRVHRLAGPEAA